jgi:fused signal recognition particle receptor
MGIFDSFRKGLKKTHDFVADGFNRIAANMGFFDEDMLDELEMLLIQADVGAACAVHLMSRVRQEIKATGDASRKKVLATLEREMLNVLGEPRPLDFKRGQLNILLMVGVNGTGKTTTAGKLCARYKMPATKSCLGQQTLSARRRSNS